MDFNTGNNDTPSSLGTPRRPERMNEDNEALLNDFELDFEMDEDSFVD